MRRQSQKVITTDLYLSGEFVDEKQSTCVTSANIIDVPGIVSSHEEWDARTVLHAIFSAQQLGTEHIVVYGNDTGIMVLLVYYSMILLNYVELWI